MLSRVGWLAVIITAFMSLASPPSVAQRFWETPAGGTVPGAVTMCVNGSNKAVPCSSTVPLETSGGAGGGAATIADGADVAQGANADAAVAAGAAGTASAKLRRLTTDLAAIAGSAALIPTATSTNAITPVVSTAAESSHILKAGAGNLYGLSVTTGAVAGYVLIFNATSAPADGAVTPTHCYSVPALSSLGVDWKMPAAFSTGITAVFSTTGCFTKTASATAFFSGAVK